MAWGTVTSTLATASTLLAGGKDHQNRSLCKPCERTTCCWPPQNIVGKLWRQTRPLPERNSTCIWPKKIPTTSISSRRKSPPSSETTTKPYKPKGKFRLSTDIKTPRLQLMDVDGFSPAKKLKCPSKPSTNSAYLFYYNKNVYIEGKGSNKNGQWQIDDITSIKEI